MSIPEAFATCPYCARPTRYGDSKEIYGTSYGPALLCTGFPACDAYSGCHKTNGAPKGPVGNASCREWRKKAHAAFDAKWKQEKGHAAPSMNRSNAYLWLSHVLDLPPEQCHIGMMEPDQCWRVLRACAAHPPKGGVYVTDSDHGSGYSLFTDTKDLKPLHEMAKRIFLVREVFDTSGVLPCYGLSPAKRDLVLKAGAVPLDTMAAILRVYVPAQELWGTPKPDTPKPDAPPPADYNAHVLFLGKDALRLLRNHNHPFALPLTNILADLQTRITQATTDRIERAPRKDPE